MFRDLHCFADPSDPQMYYYLPAAPDLRRDALQRPLLSLVDIGTSSYLMFTATWGAAAADVEALRHELAVASHEPDVNRIKLSFAPTAQLSCRALVGDGAGTFAPIAISDTSGVPPFDSVFNLSFHGEALARVRRGVGGEAGLIAIEFVAELELPLRSTAIVDARVQSNGGRHVATAHIAVSHERGAHEPIRAFADIGTLVATATRPS